MTTEMNRRAFVASMGAMGIAATAAPAFAGAGRPRLVTELGGYNADKNEFVLPPLPYAKDALEPHVDAQTMEIHHDVHHAGYVKGLNKALKELANVRAGGDAGLIKHWSREVSFHGSGHVNHTLFWNMMAQAGKGGGGQPSGSLAKAIERDFGGFDKFIAQFKAAAAQVEGSGWAWLVLDSISKTLMVIQEEKQQDMMLTMAHPILGVDVWEHAYYLKYQSKRAAYIDAWTNVINWGFAQELYDRAMA